MVLFSQVSKMRLGLFSVSPRRFAQKPQNSPQITLNTDLHGSNAFWDCPPFRLGEPNKPGSFFREAQNGSVAIHNCAIHCCSSPTTSPFSMKNANGLGL